MYSGGLSLGDFMVPDGQGGEFRFDQYNERSVSERVSQRRRYILHLLWSYVPTYIHVCRSCIQPYMRADGLELCPCGGCPLSWCCGR